MRRSFPLAADDKQFAVPASGTPLFQAATANLNPWTQAKADFKNPPTAARC
jgi:hypothetical protein